MSTNVLGQSPPNSISVLVVGAGIGGLVTAMEYSRRGCSVKILERAKETITIGDSFAIGPSAITAFRNYPDTQCENEHIAYNSLMKFCDHVGNLVKGPIDFKELLASASVDEGKRIYRHSRPKFHAMFVSQLGRMGLKVDYGHEVVEYTKDVDQGVAGVVTRDGFRVQADFVVAADGLRGASWLLVAGREIPCRPSGDAIYRVASPVEIALKDPVVADRWPLNDEAAP